MSKYQNALIKIQPDFYKYPEARKDYELLQQAIEKAKKYDEKEIEKITSETSDGYHTFNELYEHRTALFAVICNMFPNISYKSRKHDDGTMYDGMFIVGINTPKGQYSYHCNNEYFSWFKIPELEKAPKWDGHQPKDFTRLFGLFNEKETAKKRKSYYSCPSCNEFIEGVKK